MGKFDFTVDPAFIKQLGKLADVDRVAPVMVNEALPILETKLKTEYLKHKRTGELVNSIKIKKAG